MKNTKWFLDISKLGLLAFAFTAALFVGVGCAHGPAEEAGEDIDEVVDDVKDAADDVVDDVKDATN